MSESWADLADVLLQRAALVARVARDRSPDPMAGLKVDDDDLAALLGELPGMDGAWWRAEEVETATAEAAALATKRFEASLSGEGRFANLVRRVGLDPDDAVVLALICAVEADPRRQRLVGYLNDDVTARRPTVWTLGQICGFETAVAAVSPLGQLRRACLLQPPPEGPWASAPVHLAPCVSWWLSGVSSTETDLPAGAEWVWVSAGQVHVQAVAAGAPPEVSSWPGDRRIVVTSGPDRIRRLQALARGLHDVELFLVLPAAPAESSAWEAAVRQATLAGAAVVVEIGEELSPAGRDRIDSAAHLCWGLASRDDLVVSCLPTGWTGVEVDPPSASVDEWRQALGPGATPTHPLSAEQLTLAARTATALDGGIDEALRRLAAGHIHSAANRIRPARSWEDLVLDADREELVRTVAVRCRQRSTVYDRWGFSPFPSKGVVALFAGPSGTGKTLAAEVIAGDLGVDLYAIDLANLVSKYIGETEKNLGRVFDAAEASNVALFFDEADALLGKRSAVADAHDRYANIEVAYLLQRLERYSGLVVLATNLVRNIDTAFVRRLHVVVEFPMPGAAERRRIWSRSLPSRAPLAADLDLDVLSERFEIAGGTIRNAALTAAFLAAESATPITMTLAVKAIQMELRKIGRLVPDTR